jgi:hypothetical protein
MCNYAEYSYVKRCYSDVVKLVMLTIVTLSFYMLSFIMLSVIMESVVAQFSADARAPC